MKEGTQNYNEANSAEIRELRLIIELDFDGTPVYFASHARPSGLTGTVYENTIQNLSSTSQKVSPLEGRSEIGTISFDVVDLAGAISAALRTFLLNNIGTRGRLVRLYSGFSGLAWADFRLEQTQVIAKSITYDEGKYQFRCQDIQRELRKDIFTPAKTRLAASVAANGTTIQVYSSADFKPVWHGPSFSDSPGTLAAPVGVYYFKIKYQNGWEIVKATGKTSNSFTGCTRGALGTTAIAHTLEEGANEENGQEIEELVYLEMPAIKLAYALMTGKLIGQPHTLDATSGTYQDELPTNWHLGIDPAFMDLDYFTSVNGRPDLLDLYNPASDTGMIVRFDSHEKTDGKKFIEKELFLLSGVFPLVGADGRISIKRMTSVLTDASYIDTLDQTNVVGVPTITFSQDDIQNDLNIEWGYTDRPGIKGFQRTHRLIDTVSRQTHKPSAPYSLKFRALHGAVHTRNTLHHFFDALRDRHAGPPITTSLQLLPSKNRLEVGDIVRVRLPMVRDYTGNITTLDRSFEVQQVQIDQDTQKTTVKLFGSSAKAAPIAYAASYVLPDLWYTTQPGNLVPNVNGTGQLTADTNLTSGTWVVDGDLTIPFGTKLTINGTVRLLVKGDLSIFGSIDGKGRSGANGAAYFGTTKSTGRVHWYLKGGKRTVYSYDEPAAFIGQTTAVPPLNIENDAGALNGLPATLNGSKGPQGGAGEYHITGNATQSVPGGFGGNGGAGLLIVCRGLNFGAGAAIDVSGNDGLTGVQNGGVVVSGSGGGGAPGACLVLFDGPATVPIFNGHVIANYGNCILTAGARPEGPTVKVSANSGPWHSYYEGKPAESAWLSAFRFAFIPESLTAYPDYLLTDLLAIAKGSNLVAAGYSVFESYLLPPMIASDCTTATAAPFGVGVGKGLQVNVAPGFLGRVVFSDGVAAYNIPITAGKKYLFSCWISAANGKKIKASLALDNAAEVFADGGNFVNDVYTHSGGVKRISGVFDLTSSGATAGNLRVQPNADLGTNNLQMHGLMIEEANDGVFEPSAFSLPPGILKQPLTGYLTNESHILLADSSGNVIDYSGAAGTFVVFDGTQNVSSLCSFTLNPSSGVVATIDAVGGYSVTALTASAGTLSITAALDGKAVTKIFSLQKSVAGADSPFLFATTTSDAFKFDQSGGALPSNQIATIKAFVQDVAGTPTFSAEGFNSVGGSIGALTLTNVTATSAELSVGDFASSEYAIITVTLGVYSDTVRIIRVRDGSDSYAGLLTNEAVVLQAENDGTVNDFAQASGEFRVWRGVNLLMSGVTYSVQSQAGLTASITTAGAYSVSAMIADVASAVLRATVGSVVLDKVLTVAKSKEGAAGQSFAIYSTAQAFTFNSSGSAEPVAQTITFTASKSGGLGATTMLCELFDANDGSLDMVSLGGAGDIRTLTVSQFGGAHHAKITATAESFTDIITIARLAPGANAITALLTNETAAVPATEGGTVTTFAGATGEIRVFNGVSSVADGQCVYSVASTTSCAVSINSAGVYTTTALTADTGSATIRAVYNGVTLDKIFTLSKARQGSAGANGTNGTNGTNAQGLFLLPTSQSFKYNSVGVETPAGQSITFTAQLANLSGTASFSCNLYNSGGGFISAPTLGGSGNSRTLSGAQFGSAAFAVVSASLSGFSDQVTAVRVQDGQNGQDGLTQKFAYKRSASQPTTPTGSTYPPSGWSQTQPAGADPIWVTSAFFSGAVISGGWSTPTNMGQAGPIQNSSTNIWAGVAHTSEGGVVVVNASRFWSRNGTTAGAPTGTYALRRNGVQLATRVVQVWKEYETGNQSWDADFAFINVSDSPGAGAHTYTIALISGTDGSGTTSDSGSISTLEQR